MHMLWVHHDRPRVYVVKLVLSSFLLLGLVFVYGRRGKLFLVNHLLGLYHWDIGGLITTDNTITNIYVGYFLMLTYWLKISSLDYCCLA